MRDVSLMPGKPARTLALLLAGCLHLAVAGIAFWTPSQEPQGQAKAAGTGGIEISLGPAGGNAGGPKQEEGAEQAEPEQNPEPKPDNKPKPEPKPSPEPHPKPKPEPKQLQEDHRPV